MDQGASSYRRFLEGDDGGMVELIRDYKDGLIFYLSSFTGSIHTAEELMEETFVKLAIRRPRFSGRSAFKTWLYAIARNVAMDWLRKNPKGRTVSMEELGDSLAEEASLERSLLLEERAVILHRAMQKLRPEYAQVLHLIYFEKFTNAQAAAVLHKGKRQMENLTCRARKSLREELEREGFVYEAL